MKVNIGPYKNYWGVYQVTKLLNTWFGVSEDLCDDIAVFLKNTWFERVLLFFDKLNKRKIKIHIDPYDAWSLDNTLSLIIAPCLRELKQQKPGAPNVDDEDIPEKILKSFKETEPDITFLKWDYIFDEMIFAFNALEKQALGTEDWEDQFFKMKKDHNDSSLMSPIEFYDPIGHQNMNKKIQNGLRLFGKYYMALWS